MLDVELLEIQKLQFSDKPLAEERLLQFLRRTEDDSIEHIQLNPKPESLNSINGFVTLKDGTRYFFKTHVEENEKIAEYYNAEMLAKAGYPVMSAKRIRSNPGAQIVLYEVITLPTLFDVVKEEEDTWLANGPSSKLSQRADALVAAQVELDKRVTEIYRKTIESVTVEKNAAAPIHQLFHHRLQEDGRLGIFYRDKTLVIDNEKIPFSELANKHWTINGTKYGATLAELIEKAQRVMKPNAAPAVVGHGDAHNGNLFVDLHSSDKKLAFFDPAFAGRHEPLLDLTKPFFHNVFARWMYYPEQVNNEVTLTHEITDDAIVVNHNFVPSKLRREFLRSRIDNVLKPTVALLDEVREPELFDWREFLRSSLFCCPFLTVNLCANFVANGTLAERYPAAIKLLGFCMAVELASQTDQASAQESSAQNELRTIVDSIFNW